MVRLLTLIVLVLTFSIYSGFVYTTGTAMKATPGSDALAATNGKLIFQKYNCTACHQLFGLGGYLGPDLTNVMSAPGKGRMYAQAILQKGTQRMPDFKLTENEIADLLAYLSAVDAAAVKYNKQ